jgi:hypothetical protein
MCAFFCSQCYLYQLYARSGEGFCDCICGGILPLRTKIRTERGIQVNNIKINIVYLYRTCSIYILYKLGFNWQ